MAFYDLREFIKELEKIGELQHIKEEVDWNLEVGAIIRRSYDLGAPAPLFEKIKDYPQGYQILGAPVGVSSKPNQYHARFALVLGLDPSAGAIDIIEAYIRKKKGAIKPVIVDNGPCKEVIHLADDLNLWDFPAPFIHGGDGGRYIGTWHIGITKDPDSDWVNWGMYRLMVHDGKSMGGIINPPQHMGMMYYSKYEARDLPMEFAIAFGGDPIIPIMGASMIPAGVSEVDIAGAIRGRPIELVKAETVDLYVPATSEIVIEGVVNPRERRDEGPFGEYTGYRAGIKSPKPVFHVKAITHRANPILPVSCMGVPIDDSSAVCPLMMAGDILGELREAGYPVKMVFLPSQTVSHLVVISTKNPYYNYVKKLAHAIWATKAGTWLFYVMVVDDDVDITNINEVLHTLATRLHPVRGIYQVPNAPAHSLIPFLDPQDRPQGKGGAYVLFDCTWPLDWPKDTIPVKSSFDVIWPKEIQDKVLSKWTSYGFK